MGNIPAGKKLVRETYVSIDLGESQSQTIGVAKTGVILTTSRRVSAARDETEATTDIVRD